MFNTSSVFIHFRKRLQSLEVFHNRFLYSQRSLCTSATQKTLPGMCGGSTLLNESVSVLHFKCFNCCVIMCLYGCVSTTRLWVWLCAIVRVEKKNTNTRLQQLHITHKVLIQLLSQSSWFMLLSRNLPISGPADKQSEWFVTRAHTFRLTTKCVQLYLKWPYHVL